MTLRAALTGGAASGKSAAQTEFLRLGAPLLDSDQVARELLQQDAGLLAAVLGRFPHCRAADGGLDRKRLRAHISAAPAAKAWLEGLLHPLIWQRVADWQARQTAPYCVVAVPLLYESGRARDFDRVLMVDAPRALRLERLMRRDGLVMAQAQALLAVQADAQDVRGIAHRILDNSGALESLQRQVRDCDAWLRAGAVLNAPDREQAE